MTSICCEVTYKFIADIYLSTFMFFQCLFLFTHEANTCSNCNSRVSFFDFHHFCFSTARTTLAIAKGVVLQRAISTSQTRHAGGGCRFESWLERQAYFSLRLLLLLPPPPVHSKSDGLDAHSFLVRQNAEFSFVNDVCTLKK